MMLAADVQCFTKSRGFLFQGILDPMSTSASIVLFTTNGAEQGHPQRCGDRSQNQGDSQKPVNVLSAREHPPRAVQRRTASAAPEETRMRQQQHCLGKAFGNHCICDWQMGRVHPRKFERETRCSRYAPSRHGFQRGARRCKDVLNNLVSLDGRATPGFDSRRFVTALTATTRPGPSAPAPSRCGQH